MLAIPGDVAVSGQTVVLKACMAACDDADKSHDLLTDLAALARMDPSTRNKVQAEVELVLDALEADEDDFRRWLDARYSQSPSSESPDAVATEGSWLQATQPPKPAARCGPETPPPDGVEAFRWLWWQDRRYDIPQGVMARLLDHMWARDSASYDSLTGPVLEEDVQPGTIRACVSDANKILKKFGIP